eukprot:768570-Hanusia_phi.AAC.7
MKGLLPQAQTAFKRREANKRRILTEEIVIKIFDERQSGTKDKSLASQVIGSCYGISAKTVRDIWDRRTWTQVTRKFWSPEELAASSSAKENHPKKMKTEKKREEMAEVVQQLQSTGNIAPFPSYVSCLQDASSSTTGYSSCPSPTSDSSSVSHSSAPGCSSVYPSTAPQSCTIPHPPICDVMADCMMEALPLCHPYFDQFNHAQPSPFLRAGSSSDMINGHAGIQENALWTARRDLLSSGLHQAQWSSTMSGVSVRS